MSVILKPEILLPRPDPGSLSYGKAVLVERGHIAEIADADGLASRHPQAEIVRLDGCVLMAGTPDRTVAAVVSALGGPLKTIPGLKPEN